MRTLLATCTLVSAVLGAPHAHARPVADRPAPADMGVLDVSSDPPAHVFIDDADTRTVTPQHRLELKAGHHKLTLVTVQGNRKRTMGFTIEAGQTTTLSIVMKTS